MEENNTNINPMEKNNEIDKQGQLIESNNNISNTSPNKDRDNIINEPPHENQNEIDDNLIIKEQETDEKEDAKEGQEEGEAEENDEGEDEYEEEDEEDNDEENNIENDSNNHNKNSVKIINNNNSNSNNNSNDNDDILPDMNTDDRNTDDEDAYNDNTTSGNINISGNDSHELNIINSGPSSVVETRSDLTVGNNRNSFQLKKEPIKLFKKVGNTFFVFVDSYGNPLLIIGPHFGLYCCVTGIASILMLVLYIKFWGKLSEFIRILGHVCYFMFLFSYSYASLINPGYPKNTIERNIGIPRKNYYFCELCRFWIRKGSFACHCFDCNICIEGFDHHCPWTGHCIGKRNKFAFYVFLVSIVVLMVYFGIAFCSLSMK